MLYGGVAICLLVIMSIVLGVGFGTGAFKDDSTSSELESAPAPAPDSTAQRPTVVAIPEDPKSVRVREYLTTIVANPSLFNNPASPEAQALAWMQSADPLALDPQDFDSHLRLEQRYSLMTLWYSCPSTWIDQTNWMSGDECEWFGVSCQTMVPSGRNLQEARPVVTSLKMEGNNLEGPIPRDLSMLEFLLTLSLSNNKLTGALHPEMNQLKVLEELYLDSNELSGNLGNLDLSLMENLITLDLSYNQFNGGLPDTFWEFESLERLVLDGNKFSGRIPAGIASLTALSK
jgi:hypothetical protein